MINAILKLKKNADRRIRGGFPWVYSNEIDTSVTPLKQFSPGEQIQIQTHDGSFLGNAYVNPHSLISARIFSREPERLLDENLLTERLHEALRLREHIFDVPY
jgi:23S rRNA (cytosine1962-C5)-methyltransferase